MSFFPLNDATQLLASTSKIISTTILNVADTLLDRAQSQQCTTEQTEDCSKKQIIHHAKYQTIVQAIQAVTVFHHGAMIFVLFDSTLQAHRSQKIADPTINLLGNRKPTPTPTQVPDTGALIPPSLLVKQESQTTTADASTPNTTSAKPPEKAQTYRWFPTPTAKLISHINDDSFLKTIATEYPGATTKSHSPVRTTTTHMQH
jgi:hypothetical protein